MIRGLALSVVLLLTGAVPALAQTHSPSHAQGYPHEPGHVPPDPALHDALHALLHGNWIGTFSSSQGRSGAMNMLVAHHNLPKVTLTMGTDRPFRAGSANDFAMNGDKLQWTQHLSGTRCKATAVLIRATPIAPEMIKGRMACEDGELTFSLRKRRDDTRAGSVN